MHWFIAALLLIAAILAFGFAALAGADPEGRGGMYMLCGFGGMVVFFIGAIVAACW
jgi:hypothetical protein